MDYDKNQIFEKDLIERRHVLEVMRMPYFQRVCDMHGNNPKVKAITKEMVQIANTKYISDLTLGSRFVDYLLNLDDLINPFVFWATVRDIYLAKYHKITQDETRA